MTVLMKIQVLCDVTTCRLVIRKSVLSPSLGLKSPRTEGNLFLFLDFSDEHCSVDYIIIFYTTDGSYSVWQTAGCTEQWLEIEQHNFSLIRFQTNESTYCHESHNITTQQLPHVLGLTGRIIKRGTILHNTPLPQVGAKNSSWCN
jgi:hypothetical protein